MVHFTKTPAAYALLKEEEGSPDVKGRIDLYEVYGGTLVVTEVYGLRKEPAKSDFWRLYIHDEELPPILNQDGIGWMAVYTKQFFPEEMVGKRAVIPIVASGEIIAWDREIR